MSFTGLQTVCIVMLSLQTVIGMTFSPPCSQTNITQQSAHTFYMTSFIQLDGVLTEIFQTYLLKIGI